MTGFDPVAAATRADDVEMNSLQRFAYDELVQPYLDGRRDGMEWAHIDNARDELRYALQGAVLALAAVRAENERLCQVADEYKDRTRKWRLKAEQAEAKVRAVELLHVWTNEDGKRFVFADDLGAALQIPGYDSVSTDPQERP